MFSKVINRYIDTERKGIYNFCFFVAMAIYFPLLLISISYAQPLLGEMGVKIIHYVRILAYIMLLMIVSDHMMRSFVIGLKERKFLPTSELIIIIALVVAFLSAVVSHKSEAFVIMLIISAAIEVKPDTKKFFAGIALIQFVSIILFAVLAVEGVLPDVVRHGYNGQEKHGLGFVYHTFGPMLMLFISMEYIYVRDVKKISIVEIIVLFSLNYLLYKYCGSRNSFYIACMVLMVGTVYRFVPLFMDRLMGLISKLYGVMIAFVMFCSFGVPKLYMKFWHGNVDGYFSTLAARLRLSNEAMEKYHLITAFGQNIEWIGSGMEGDGKVYNFVDNAYLQMLLDFGIIYFALAMMIYVLIIITFKKEKEYMNMIMICLILGLAVIDPRLWVLVFNPFPMLVSLKFEEIVRKNLEKKREQ